MSFRLHESFIYDAHFERRKHFECKRNKAEHQEMLWCVCVRACVYVYDKLEIVIITLISP